MTAKHAPRRPQDEDTVLMRFAVPAKMARVNASEVLIWTCAGGVIRIPKTLLKEQSASELLFEAKVARDVSATIRSLCGEIFRSARAAGEQ